MSRLASSRGDWPGYLLCWFGCFARTELRRVSNLSPATVSSELAALVVTSTRLSPSRVRELGPVVKLLSSAALVEGGTEVVLQVNSRRLRQLISHVSSRSTGAVAGQGWSRAWPACQATWAPPCARACSLPRPRSDA